jgi:PAS domain S-box-containing protein
MKRFLRRLPLTSKLLLVGVVPLALLVYMTVELYREKNREVELLHNYLDRISQSVNLSRLISEIQNEQRASFTLVMEHKGAATLSAQRRVTDAALRLIDSAGAETLGDYRQYTFLNNLHRTRISIDSNQATSGSVTQFYTNAIYRLNTLNVVSVGNNNYLQPVFEDLTAQQALSQMVTFIGIISNNIYSCLYTRQYMLETLAGTLGVYQVNQTYEAEFLLKASPEAESAYQEARARTALGPTQRYIDTLFATFRFDSALTAAQWQQLSNDGIQSLKGVQAGLLKRVDDRVHSLYAEAARNRDRAITLLVLALLIVFALIASISYVLTKLLKDLKAGARALSRGVSGFSFTDMPPDVIGSLAHSMADVDANNQALARAADEFGKGNFDVPLVPRSDADLLGNSLQLMKANLQRLLRELEESREQFRQLADLMPQIVWTSRPDGTIDYYNKQWYVFTGLTPGHSVEESRLVAHPDNADALRKLWADAAAAGLPYETEHRFFSKPLNMYRWLLIRSVPIRDADGTILKWFGTCTDIHEQKTMNEKLEQVVTQRTEELKRSNDDLQQFAHVASHDLKEPLRKIRTFSSRLQEYSDMLPERGRDYLVRIEGSAARMSAMVEGILNYSIADMTAMTHEPVALAPLFDEIAGDLELVIQQKNARIERGPLPVVKGLPILLSQLFYNLVNNALKFSQPGRPPVVRISARPVTREEGALLAGTDPSFVAIEIHDNGIGFPPEQAAKIFQLFSRLHAKEEYEGTGLGLALCQKIAQRHGGFISAEAVPGEGAVFSVVLPLGEGHEASTLAVFGNGAGIADI